MPLDLTDNPVVSHRPQGCAGTTLRPRQPCWRHGGTRWFVVRCIPRLEPVAVAGIAEQNFPTFLPLVATTRWNRHAHRQRVTVLEPLFKTYGFAAFDRDQDPWPVIQRTRGVLSLILDGMKPAPVQEGAVEALQAGEALRRCHPTGDAATLAPGSAVAVRCGPFSGHRGQLVAAHRDRAVVTLLLFGRLQDVHVAVADLVSAGEIC
jgi:transcription antitermination factor NusG